MSTAITFSLLAQVHLIWPRHRPNPPQYIHIHKIVYVYEYIAAYNRWFGDAIVKCWGVVNLTVEFSITNKIPFTHTHRFMLLSGRSRPALIKDSRRSGWWLVGGYLKPLHRTFRRNPGKARGGTVIGVNIILLLAGWCCFSCWSLPFRTSTCSVLQPFYTSAISFNTVHENEPSVYILCTILYTTNQPANDTMPTTTTMTTRRRSIQTWNWQTGGRTPNLVGKWTNFSKDICTYVCKCLGKQIKVGSDVI